MKQVTFIRSGAVCVLLMLLGLACSLGEPSRGSVTADLEWRIGSGASDYLFERVSSAKSSIKLALFDIPDDELRDLLVSKANEGLSVEIVLGKGGAGNAASLNGASGKTIAKSRPLTAEYPTNWTPDASLDMRQNFAIIDERTAIFFTDERLAASCTLALIIRQEYLLDALAREFSQMFRDGKYGQDKVKYVNYMQVFPSTSGDIDMYFLPGDGYDSDEVFGFVRDRVRQARQTLHAYGRRYSNTELNGVFQIIKNSAAVVPERLTAEFSSGNSAAFPAFAEQGNRLGFDLSCNAIFIDTETPDATMIFVTCPFDKVSESRYWATGQYDGFTTFCDTDGIVLFIRGDTVRQIKVALDAAIAGS